METALDRPVVVTRDQLAFLSRLSRIAASNVVNESVPSGALIDRIHSHVTAESDPRNMPYLKRKRTQPHGSVACVGQPGIACERIVSGNKGRCLVCTEAMENQEAAA